MLRQASGAAPVLLGFFGWMMGWSGRAVAGGCMWINIVDDDGDAGRIRMGRAEGRGGKRVCKVSGYTYFAITMLGTLIVGVVM